MDLCRASSLLCLLSWMTPPPLHSARHPDLSMKPSLHWSLFLFNGFSTDSMAPQMTRCLNLPVTLTELSVLECKPLLSFGNPPDPPDVCGSMSLTATKRFSPLPSPHFAHPRCPSDFFWLPSLPSRSQLPILPAFFLHIFQVCSSLPSRAFLILIRLEIVGERATLVLEFPDMLSTLPIDLVLIALVRSLTVICNLFPNLTLVDDVLNYILPDF